MRSRSNGGVIGAYALPTQNYANGVFFIHDAAIYNTGVNPIWPLGTGYIYSATGGTISTAIDNSNYKIHTFTSNSTFTIATGAAEIEILLVGGGGAGGSIYGNLNGSKGSGGGGGGGGVTVVRTFAQAPVTFNVTVGPGGVPSPTYPFIDAHGVDSSVTSTAGHSYTAQGGGSGGNLNINSASNGYDGGSGGGGAVRDVNPASTNTIGIGGTGYAELGNNGIDGYILTPYTSIGYSCAGGGGGASSTGNKSDGGNGYFWSRTGGTYGSGGGGGRNYLATSDTTFGQGTAGLFGGNGAYTLGSGTVTQAGTNASTSGYGGGGGGAVSNYQVTSGTITISGGNGGKGTVIFCYRYK